ncbi:MAG: segregation/condensation protein A [Halothiobacillaceae bacterium]|nr:segregation/condensation protein A [Halothiobacillaceae bacterium]HER34379.1 segregation/condensation protein A [Halothiobacillaceae bacterium]
MSSEARAPAGLRWVDATPRVSGEPMEQLPLDLYIPADALAIWLEQFEGPLDLLLYLIRKHNIDILEIPVARVTEQYLEYLALMKSMAIELAAEYLLMAAWLTEIKSRMLLPPEPRAEDDEEPLDPRAELVARLLEYERTTRAATYLDQRPRRERDWFGLSIEPPHRLAARPVPADLAGLIATMQGLLREGSVQRAHHVRAEPLSIRQRMTEILDALAGWRRCELADIFRADEGRLGVAVTTVAILELSRTRAIDWSQEVPFGPVTLFRPADEPVGRTDSSEAQDERTGSE